MSTKRGRGVATKGKPWPPKRYLRLPYHRCLVPNYDEHGAVSAYTATILEFPGCIAEGTCPGEALRNVESTAEAWLDCEIAMGHTIPKPVDYRESLAWLESRMAHPWKSKRRKTRRTS